MKQHSALIEELLRCYESGEFSSAKKLMDRIIEADPVSLDALGARYLRARAYEDGYFGCEELNLAISDYAYLIDHSEDYRSNGLIGYSRVLLAIDESANALQVVDLLRQAISHDRDVRALLLLGKVYEEILKNDRLAAKCYFDAFRRGTAWGLRLYARLQMKRKNYVSGIMLHFLTTVFSPFMYLIYRVDPTAK